MKPIHIFFLTLGIAGFCLYAEVNKPVLPYPPTDGTVPVKLGNAGPQQIDIRITTAAGKVYSVLIPRCPTCLPKTMLPPEGTGCPSDTVYKSFTLKPEFYKVDVVEPNGNVTYSSKLDLSDGKPYDRGTCFFQMQIPPKHRDLQEKP